MKYPMPENRNIFITGCSSGIGWSTMELFLSRGWSVWASARKEADLERIREAGAHAVALDLSRTEDVERAGAQVLEAAQGRISALVNNAGFGQPGAVEQLTRDTLRQQFEVNVFGLQQLTNAFLPGFRAAGAGRIVNISSVLGRVSMPMMGCYSASKYAVESLSDALRVELRHSGVAVSLVEPGPIRTQFWENAVHAADDQRSEEKKSAGFVAWMDSMKQQKDRGELLSLPPSAAARRIMHAVASPRPRSRYRVTVHTHAIEILRRFTPAAFIDLLLVMQTRT